MKKSYLFLAAGMVLFVASNGRWTVPAMAWLAPVFLLRFLRPARPATAVPLLAVLFCLASRVMFHEIIPSGLGMLGLGLTVYFGFIMFLPYAIDRWLEGRAKGFLSTLIFPSACVAVEYLNALAFGDWASLAFTQAENLPLIQVLSLSGLWGVTFLVAWPGPVILWLWKNGFSWPKLRPGVLSFVGVLASVFVYGGIRLALLSPVGPTVRVASLHLDDTGMAQVSRSLPGPEASLKEREEVLFSRQKALARYFEKTRECARRGAAVVLWPEASITVSAEEESEFLAKASSLAAENQVYFLAAYYREAENEPLSRGANKCALFDSRGHRVVDYTKSHPVPGSPDEAGDGVIPVVDTPFGRVAMAICYDMDFPGLIRQAGRKKAELFLVPAWDWKAIDPLHARMAAFRAIENGFAMVRHTAEGLSLAVEATGRTVAALDHFRTSDRVMTADLSARRLPTFYSWAGDWLAWLALAFVVFSACRALVAGPGGKTRPEPLIPGKPPVSTELMMLFKCQDDSEKGRLVL